MKSLLAITFSFLVLFQSAGLEINDILLFGRLVQHAEYHSENYGDGFLTFFEKHYGALKVDHKKNHKEEKQEHEELPFQNFSFHHSITDGVLATFEIPILKGGINFYQSHTFFYQNLYSSLEKVSIFQPPKFA